MTDDDRDVRLLLEDAVSGVEPDHGLDAIRSRTSSAGHRRPWAWGAAAAVVATAAVIAAVVGVAGLPGTDRSTAPADGTPASERVSSPWVVPVYYLGETGVGPRLFREMRLGPPTRSDDKVRDAVQQAVDGDPFDPDYRSVWPAGTEVAGVTRGGSAVTVDLRGDGLADRPAGMSQREAEASVQQLLWTARANLHSGRLPVRFEVGGSAARTLLGVPVTGPVSAGSAEQVLAPVSIDQPAEMGGRNLGVRSPVAVTGRASAFEANVQWELLQGDTVVKRGFTTARACCTLSPYTFRFRAAPGDYTLVVHDEDVSGGEGTGATSRDTKRIHVSR